MANVLVQELDSAVVQRLSEQARRNGRSFEAEVKVILEAAAMIDHGESAAEDAAGIRSDTDIALTVAQMANGLHTLGKPAAQESVGLGVDPDEYPLY